MGQIYVERGVAMAFECGVAVWSFAPPLWGVCVQAEEPEDAVAEWVRQFGAADVAEIIEGDEQAFTRDRVPASDAELSLTLHILDVQRQRALSLLASLSPDVLDQDFPDRHLPSWAHWRTIRQMLWHICDTESRYYLPRLGLASRPRARSLAVELADSSTYVRQVLTTLPRDLVTHTDGEVWTSTKLLRRLAWHERGELDAIEELLAG